MVNKNIYLLDGSFTSGIKPYVDIDSVMSHPLWGSHLLLNDEESILSGCKDYIKAGVDFLSTCTYQASIAGFQKHLGLNYDQSIELIKKSVKICRRAIIETNSEQNVQVMGSVGPYGASLCDGSEYNGSYIDTINLKEIYNWHKPRIQALIEAGVDVVLFETIPSVGEANLLLNILSEFPNQKACLSFSCKDDTHISHGETFANAVEKVWSDDPQRQLIAIGMNCLHPKLITPLLKSVKTENVKFIIYPNGGGIWNADLKCWDSSQVYKITIDDLSLWRKYGLKIFGGCCSIDPAEIAQFKSLINVLN